MRSQITALALVAVAALLASCGRQATLERPAPRVGKARTPSAAERARSDAAARARADGAASADPQAPQSVEEVRGQNLPTQRERAIPGTPQGPNPINQGGLLPDPAEHPAAANPP